MVGDFNGDGRLDFVTAYTNAPSTQTVRVFLGNGDGTFQSGQSIVGTIPNTRIPSTSEISTAMVAWTCLCIGELRKSCHPNSFLVHGGLFAMPIAGLLVGVGGLKDRAFLERRPCDLQADGHPVTTPSAWNSNSWKASQVVRNIET